MRRASQLARRAAILGGPVVAAVAVALTLFACCCPDVQSPTTRLEPVPSPPIGLTHFEVPKEVVPAPRTQVQMRNVAFRIDPTIPLFIHTLRGEMYDKAEGQPLNFDNKHSFIVRILRGRIGVSNRGLTDLMNRYVFDYPSAPLKKLTVNVRERRMVLEGEIHKLVDIPFVMTADVSADEGWLRIHPIDIEVCNVDGERLMRSFGLTLEEILEPLPEGVRVVKNDMLVHPLRILPPPTIVGTLTDVELHENELVQIFTSDVAAADLAPEDTAEPNWMFFREGTLRMGKLFMVGADMQVIDSDPGDPFDFFIDFYNNQLVSGFTRNTPDYGLKAFMRDYADLGTPAKSGERLAPQ